MKKIIEKLNRNANSIEETCCGIRNFWKEYENNEIRQRLIEQIDYYLEEFTDALNDLKSIK